MPGLADLEEVGLPPADRLLADLYFGNRQMPSPDNPALDLADFRLASGDPIAIAA